MNTTRVLIVDDSELIRSILTTILSGDPTIEVVGTAADPFEARHKIKQLNPDVITLDVEMPRMDGITFLKNLMRLRPTPVVMISTLTQQGAEITIEALELGAVDFITKPRVSKKDALLALTEVIQEKVRHASRVNPASLGQSNAAKAGNKISYDTANCVQAGVDIIAIGASTGGTTAIKDVLAELPANMPPIVIVQHMPEQFTASFAARLDKASDINVLEVIQDNTLLKPGHAYLARGDQHMKVALRGGIFYAELDDSGPVSGHKPSVNVLFDSVAKLSGARSVGVLLTGMGSDGATGLGRMKQKGSVTVAQDEATSVVWGMPGVAVRAGAVDKVLPLDKVAEFLVRVCYSGQLPKRTIGNRG
ncbi:protein-glutamate methylesterase/protein-glutamine glutaminase [Halioxenophilus aromaticivorans]|uniref:Protein-glutamate methylesterase/protein-glutamine glutaminase n=1 Tax=Halioxenophilus aromaticivorans TaxID=1306992 RepID=A0AAV3U2K6_9ALTE